MIGRRINSRSKGIRGEQQAIKLLQPILDEVYPLYDCAIPVLQRNTVQSDQGGYDVVGLGWLALEVKNVKGASPTRYWNQAVRQAAPEQEPIVLFKAAGVPDFRAILRVSIPCGPRFIHGFAVVDIDTFLVWFRARLVFELERDLTLKGFDMAAFIASDSHPVAA